LAGQGTHRREWRPFEEAREFARSLGLKGKIEWQEYAKSGKRPADIPSSPDKIYKSRWKGWKDWVGTQWRPFGEARKFVHSLGLRNQQEWQAYIKSGEKPASLSAGRILHFSWVLLLQGQGSGFEGYPIAAQPTLRKFWPWKSISPCPRLRISIHQRYMLCPLGIRHWRLSEFSEISAPPFIQDTG
jgi:hypothetical protein